MADHNLLKTFTLVLFSQFQALSFGQSCSGSCKVKPLCRLKWLDNDWVLVFRLTSAAKASAYDAFFSSNKGDLTTEKFQYQPGCLNTSGDCSTHFRSDVLDIWPYAGIDKVRVAVYTGGVEKAHIVFDGRDTSNTGWFQKEKIVSSSWDDLKDQSFPFFAIDGPNNRRFYITTQLGSCTDKVHLLVLDSSDIHCSNWTQAKGNKPFPNIFYSHLAVNGQLTADTDLADVLIVSVKLVRHTRPADCD